MKISEHALVEIVRGRYPDTIAVYLFGSQAEGTTHPESDLDLAILLPFATASRVDTRDWIDLTQKIESSAGVDRVDLINLRRVDTIFRMQIIHTGNRLYCSDEAAADEYEVLTMGLYQQLEFERKEIVEEGIRSGRFHHV